MFSGTNRWCSIQCRLCVSNIGFMTTVIMWTSERLPVQVGLVQGSRQQTRTGTNLSTDQMDRLIKQLQPNGCWSLATETAWRTAHRDQFPPGLERQRASQLPPLLAPPTGRVTLDVLCGACDSTRRLYYQPNMAISFLFIHAPFPVVTLYGMPPLFHHVSLFPPIGD